MADDIGYDGRISKSWKDLEEATVTLAQKITDYSRTKNLKFDKMIVIPKGGYFLGLLLPEMLGFDNDQLLHTAVQSYVQGEEKQTGSIVVGEMPTEDHIRGQDLLVVDEVWDTGVTLDFIVRYLKDRGSKSITIAVLHYKPGMSRIKDKKPDIFVEETNAWIDYAWEQARVKGKQEFKSAKMKTEHKIIKLDPPPAPGL